MNTYNTWFPGKPFYSFPEGAVARTLSNAGLSGATMAVDSFTIPNQSAGFGVVAEHIYPPFAITKPPKIAYTSDKDLRLSIKDADGWMWVAPMPAQGALAERGWSWDLFELADVQDNGGEPPSAPAQGNVQAFQIQGAPEISGAVTVKIAYIAGRSPGTVSNSGELSLFSITSTDPQALTLKIGDVRLEGGSRRPLKYNGALPFGFIVGGPNRSNLSTAPYRGPYIAGYQSGTPWVDLGETVKLGALLDFMQESQVQFRDRHPQRILGPFMHCYLPVVWDAIQTGPVDSWVWDAPDGNPAWSGWQYRAFDAIAETWALMAEKNMVGMAKAATVTNRFATWLAAWLAEHPTADLIPSDWAPPGWAPGQPLAPESYLDPKGTFKVPHDMALCLKAALYARKAGGAAATYRPIIRRMIRALATCQVPAGESPMRGAFSLNPEAYESYGFHQGEIMDALALALQNPDYLT